ncbi:hypothetical protein [Corynebacterium sp. LK2510]|uniref:hypothetical protein n=1 Tax=Corynebacterium sp. LK2510 TaxID=3110472 RepID=UPI0034CE78EB
MDSSGRDLSRALGAGLLIAAAIVLVITLRVPGIVVAVLLAAGVFALLRRYNSDPELASLTASLEIARDDIADILAQFDDLEAGLGTDALAQRTLYMPALTDPYTTHPDIQEFRALASSARRFVSRIDARISEGTMSRAQLERLIAVADERAQALDSAWNNAKRAARELGPGTR